MRDIGDTGIFILWETLTGYTNNMFRAFLKAVTLISDSDQSVIRFDAGFTINALQSSFSFFCHSLVHSLEIW